MTSPGGRDPLPPTTGLERAMGLTSDWPAQAADRIVAAVDTVRDKTTGPAQKAARAVVYGVVALSLGIVLFVLVIIGMVRLLDVIVDHFFPWGHAWLPYMIMGAIFLSAGWVVFRRRRLA
jgi:hypothetical protein